MTNALTPEEIQRAMAVYATDDETRLRTGGDETEIVALTDGGNHRVDELQQREAPGSVPDGDNTAEDGPPAFPV